MSKYINEAFRKFTLLEDSEDFDITPEGIDNLSSFMDTAMHDEDTDVQVIDPEAENEDELKQSYVGKIICDCNVCHSHIFFNKEDIVIDEDDVVNADEECPYCMSTDGYTIIGEIKNWSPEVEDEIEDEPSDEEMFDDELADEPIEIEDEEETEVVEEGLKKKFKKRKLAEGYDIKRIKEIEDEINADFSGLSFKKYYEDNQKIYLTIGDTQGNIARITIPKWELDDADIAYCVFSHLEDAIDDGRLLEEGLKLDGVKSLRGTKGLRRRLEKDGVKSLRGRANSKISGTEDLNESISRDDLENWLGEHETATKDIEKFYKKSLDKLTQDEMLDWIEDHKQLADDLHKHFNESIENVELTPEAEDLLYEIAERYTTSTPVSGDWATETAHEMKAIAKELGVNYGTAKQLMMKYLGFEEDMFDGTSKQLLDIEGNLNESIENVTIDTEDETMTMTTKDDGGVVVETSPRESFSDEEPLDMDMPNMGDEVIAPLDAETEDEILDNSEGEEIEDFDIEEETPEEEVAVDEFDEESFDELGEAYLRRNYDNVRGFKTTQVKVNENLLKIDGIITFKSGNQKKTNFIFESTNSAKGKFIFEGYNQQITGKGNAFRMKCSIQNKKIIPESIKYNYASKNALNESVKLTGTVKTNRK